MVQREQKHSICSSSPCANSCVCPIVKPALLRSAKKSNPQSPTNDIKSTQLCIHTPCKEPSHQLSCRTIFAQVAPACSVGMQYWSNHTKFLGDASVEISVLAMAPVINEMLEELFKVKLPDAFDVFQQVFSDITHANHLVVFRTLCTSFWCSS